MFRFTIRDVLWLTVVVAMGAGWTVSDRVWVKRYDVLRVRCMECEIDRQVTHQRWDGVQEVLEKAGIEWPAPVWRNGARAQPIDADANQ